MVTWAGVGPYKGVTSRSCKGHLKVTAWSNQPKIVKIVSFRCYCSNSVHLRWLWLLKPTQAPTRRYTKHISRGYRVIWGLEGNTPQNDLYVTPIPYDRNRPNNRYSVMFGPITNTLLKVMKPNPSKHGETGWGRASYGYYPKVKSRLSQGHIPGQISQKRWK